LNTASLVKLEHPEIFLFFSKQDLLALFFSRNRATKIFFSFENKNIKKSGDTGYRLPFLNKMNVVEGGRSVEGGRLDVSEFGMDVD